ncbi:MAG: ribonuclease P protein component [Gammaproteobacteria bacterium]
MNPGDRPSGTRAFPRASRLLTSAEFRGVFGAATKSADRYFVVLARPNDTGRARLGLAIAKKQLRRAVARNRVKRLVRESFRHAQDELAGLDLVVMARSGIAATPNRPLREALDRHWRRLRNLPRA